MRNFRFIFHPIKLKIKRLNFLYEIILSNNYYHDYLHFFKFFRESITLIFKKKFFLKDNQEILNHLFYFVNNLLKN